MFQKPRPERRGILHPGSHVQRPQPGPECPGPVKLDVRRLPALQHDRDLRLGPFHPVHALGRHVSPEGMDDGRVQRGQALQSCFLFLENPGA